MALAVGASAQEPPPAASKAIDGVVLGADLVKTGLYVITGGGGNSLLRLSASGSILVDGKRPGSYSAVMAQVRRISKLSDLPVRVLIVTDHHEDHAGNTALFAQAGVAQIVQQNALPYLPAPGPAGAKKPAPVISFDREYRLKMGGVEAQLFHFGNAHTKSDTVVYFPDLKVVAVGELFSPGTPAPDFAAGGSLVNWGSVLAQILKFDIDVVAPSTGPMVSRADLDAFKTKLDLLVARARALVKSGVAKDQLMARLKTDDLGWQFSFDADQVERFFDELSSTN